MMRRPTRSWAAPILAALLASSALAAEWPQFHGPRRDNQSTETGLLKQWPAEGPQLLWTATGIGTGFSNVAIADGLIYTTGNVGKDTVITALGLDGKPRWTARNGPAYKRSQPGTRSIPTLDSGRLYHENADGDLVCLEAKSGKPIWSLNILEKFGGRNIEWGLAESLLIDGDRVICTPGGEKAGLAALDKTTGETVWVCPGPGDKPGYCSPIVVEHQGLRQIVTLLAKSAVGVHARTGALLWRVDQVTPFDENITTPIFHDGCVFISTRTTGSKLLRLKVEGETCSVGKPLWHTDELDSQHEGVLLLDGHLYGSCLGRPSWSCLEFATGKRTLGARGIGRASVTYADGHIYAVNFGGTVALVRPDPRNFVIVSQFQAPRGGRGPFWAHPVVCGGRLYIRHADALHCYDIAAK